MSNVTGDFAAPQQITSPAYWREHVRSTVRFADGIEKLWREGYRTFIEVGPSPTLLTLARASRNEEPALWLATLNKRHNDSQSFLEAVARLYVGGYNLDFDSFFQQRGGIRIKAELPTYPFERR